MIERRGVSGSMRLMSASPRVSIWSRAAPGLSLMILAPLLAEILPGATRFSAIFVLPIEICVWGGGALFIRYAVRRWRLGWRNMLLLALALAVAEECIIQQTSLAPLVISAQRPGLWPCLWRELRLSVVGPGL